MESSVILSPPLFPSVLNLFKIPFSQIAEQFSLLPNMLLQTHQGVHRAKASSLLTLSMSLREKSGF